MFVDYREFYVIFHLIAMTLHKRLGEEGLHQSHCIYVEPRELATRLTTISCHPLSMCFYIAKRGKPPKAGNSGKPRSLRSSAPSPSPIPWPSSSSLSGTVDESNAPDHSSSIVQELDEEGVTDDCGQLTARDSCSKLTEESRHHHGSI